MSEMPFLSGVPVDHVMARLRAAGGDEIDSGKLASPESSAALAVNCFGWFIERPELFPALPGLEAIGRAEMVDVEFNARFPWAGGTHPWLDAVVQAQDYLVGIESKRLEPFRDRKKGTFSDAYDRPVWGANMRRYESMRDALRSRTVQFVHLDAVQLVKHAFGLVTEAGRRQRKPVLFYIFAEPKERAGKAISPADLDGHRSEVEQFAAYVAGDEVQFRFSSYRDWISTWHGAEDLVTEHGARIIEIYRP